MYMIDEGKVFTCTRLFTMSSILIPVEDADTSPIIFWASKRLIHQEIEWLRNY